MFGLKSSESLPPPPKRRRLVGQKPPLEISKIWSIRVRLQLTGNLRAVELLLGHSKLESTVRHPGVEIDDALELAEQTEA
jgi:hypothetical protein